MSEKKYSLIKRIKQFIQKKLDQIQYSLFKSDNLIINWSDFDKGVLLLIFGIASSYGAISWYLFVYFSPDRIWLNLDFFPYRLTTVSITFVVFILLTIASYKYHESPHFRTFISYFSPFLFGMTMIYGGYTVGIYSAATIAGIVNIVLVGLVFYKRSIVYSILFPVTIFLSYVGYLSYQGDMTYAPVFSEQLNQSDVYRNRFWLQSMALLYLPILFVSALFFEILLSQWRRREKNIERMSQTDALTEVYNRRYITDKLKLLEAKAEYAVVLLDLDHFKKINDMYGHDAGDRVLKSVALILKDCVREDDIVGRFGGEEFILVLKMSSLAQALEIAERCRQKIEKQSITLENQHIIQVSASFGVALSQVGKTKETIIRLADEALYEAKAQGRNRICSHKMNE